MRTGQAVEDILDRTLDEARRKRDKQAMIRIRRALKFVRERNKRKRRRRQ